MFDVACLGNLVADVITLPVNEIPEAGKLTLIEQITLHSGGCAMNTCIDLVKLGLKATVLGMVGKDGFAEFMLGTLKAHGIDTNGVAIKEGVNTSSSVVLVSNSGERTFLHCIGASAHYGYDDVNFDLIKNSKILFVGGTNLLPKFDGEPCSRLLKKAREQGVYTALDTAWDATGRWMKIIEPCLPHLDLFIPSYDEARMISGKDEPEEIADVFLARGVRLAVIKLGKEGCYIKSCLGEKYRIPTYTEIKAVDATGAGDSFVAGFLAGVLQGWDLQMCGKFANAVGTHCVMEIGATTGIRSMAQILDFMNKH